MPPTTAAIAWCFTINNPQPLDYDPIDASVEPGRAYQTWMNAQWDHVAGWDDVKYVVWQQEKGEDGTIHFQGYVEWEKPKRLSACKKINGRAHWEQRYASQAEAIAYCKKEDTRIAGPWEKGTPGPGQGSRTDLDAVGKQIVAGTAVNEIAKENPALYIQYGRGMRDLAMVTQGKYNHGDVRGVWYWGGPGTGKSRKAREEYPEAYLKAQNKWMDGYAGEHEIILDDLDKLGGDKLGHYLKIWADRYACTAEIKGGTVNLQHRVFVITSNYHPDTMWPDDEEMLQAIKRRFKITHFGNLRQTNKRKRDEMEQDGPACPFGCPDTAACMCVQSGRVERQL